jgi:2-keto-4-pentenoate hydratase/2-oxohepta-3-ene-1,7-dioic acid hydratase in catechol pathway
MRWARYRHDGAVRCGVVVSDAVYEADGVSLPDLVAAGTLAAVGATALDAPARIVGVESVELLAPLPCPPSIRDYMAFEQHVEGMGRLVGAEPRVPDVWYDQPLFYFTNPSSVIGPYDDVRIPPGCAVFDFELEVAAVVGPRPAGAPLTNLSIAEAGEIIAGYVLVNDWSARDLQMREMQGPLGPCKGKDAAITFGPWLVSADELPGLAHGSTDIELGVEVDDRYAGSDQLGSMSWTFAEMIAYASRGALLQPGDVFASGTCGDGCLAERWGRAGRDAAAPLHPHEVVRMSGGPLGAIANRVVASTPITTPLERRARRY